MNKRVKSPRTLHHNLARRKAQRRRIEEIDPVVSGEPIVTDAPPPEESSRHRWGIGMIGGTVITVTAMVAAVVWYRVQASPTSPAPVSSESSEQIQPVIPTPSWQRDLDGVSVSSEASAHAPLVAIVVDNMIDARPQSGIDRALWVFEFPAEATITRWLAIFSLDQVGVTEIGPVRSLRPYMAEVARSLSAVVVHSGGSPDALKLVGRFAKDYPSINEFANAPLFWRDRSRPAPHNLYTTVLRLMTHPLVAPAQRTLKPLPWANTRESAVDDAQKTLTIHYSEPYTARWQYRPDEEVFYRVDEKGAVIKLRDGNPITAKSIVVQSTDISVLDAIGRRSMRLTGSGDAMVFEQGHVELGQWQRQKPSDRTTLVLSDGQPLPLGPGRVWWTIVPKGTEVDFE
ncbi:DUF3048 domain-containing protein [Candidatus Uhrbacteria bacterium]|nr:DUF3048 domain-containing protein [Candidatus Uhrbacteria bacterium]